MAIKNKGGRMAVKIDNVHNTRKSQLWNEQDDAALCVLLKRKIKDTSIAIRESETPYERSRLKNQKRHYVNMLRKVERGAYNGDIIFNELRASAALREEDALNSNVNATMAGGKKYINSYGAVDFDYEAAFRKKRYYGFSLPFILFLLTLVMIAVLVFGMLMPVVIEKNPIAGFENTTGLHVNALFVYRLSPTNDVTLKADDNGKWWWPEGEFVNSAGEIAEPPKFGEPYTDESGKVYDEDGVSVSLYTIGYRAIYIDAADIIKAWFKTKMLEKTRLDFLEDRSIFQGESYFYALFLSGSKSDDLVIRKNDDGQYDFGVILNHIGVYGVIIFTLLTFIWLVVLFLQNFIRMFTYTSRGFHVATFFCLLSSLFAFFLCPVFATCQGTEIGPAFSNFFLILTNPDAFYSLESEATAGLSIVGLIPAAVCLIMMILPKLFKNRLKKMPTHIPKGNNMHV